MPWHCMADFITISMPGFLGVVMGVVMGIVVEVLTMATISP